MTKPGKSYPIEALLSLQKRDFIMTKCGGSLGKEYWTIKMRRYGLGVLYYIVS